MKNMKRGGSKSMIKAKKAAERLFLEQRTTSYEIAFLS